MLITGTAPTALYHCRLLGLHPGAVAMFITGAAPTQGVWQFSFTYKVN